MSPTAFYCWETSADIDISGYVLALASLFSFLTIATFISPQRVSLLVRQPPSLDPYLRWLSVLTFIACVAVSVVAVSAHMVELMTTVSHHAFSVNASRSDTSDKVCCDDRQCKRMRTVMIDLFAVVLPVWLTFKLMLTAVFIRRSVSHSLTHSVTHFCVSQTNHSV